MRATMKLVLVGALVLGISAEVGAQERQYPTRAVEIIVPYDPGGGIDLFFRLLAEELTKTMKVRVNILNQTAAGGAIAASNVANARKDGYMMLGILLGSLASMTAANPQGPVHLLRDFDPIAILYGYAAVVMMSKSDSELKTLKDVIEYARKKPGELIVAAGPVGTSLYLQVEQLKRAANINVTSLPFPGGAQGLTNLLGGHVHLAMTSDVAASPHVRAGKLRAIASDIKSSVLPDVRTFAEQGYPQVNLLASLALLGPKGLPRDVTTTLENAVKGALKEPGLVATLGKRGFNIDLRTGSDQLSKLVKEEIEKYAQFSAEELGWKMK